MSRVWEKRLWITTMRRRVFEVVRGLRVLDEHPRLELA